jgi:creatinine amidohydrolase
VNQLTKDYALAKMTWEEVEKRLEESSIILVPVGSTEQHGPALPVEKDHYIATEFATRTADKVWDEMKITIAPTVAYGFSHHHTEFPGTVSIRQQTLSMFLIDICRSLDAHGFDPIILLNGHGGNSAAITNALHTLRDDHEIIAYAVNWWSLAMDKIREVATPPVYHACDMETSVAWHLGQRVLEEKRVDEPGKSPVPDYVVPDMLAGSPTAQMATMMKQLTDTGNVGYSTQATREKGEAIGEVVIERLIEFIMRVGK